MKIDVQSAEVKTASVEVRTLNISGKQVTLSVFRQLEQEDLLTEDHDLKGPAWGRVNYHPDKCADTAAHIHVVWQTGSELRRSLIRKPPTTWTFWADDEHLRALLAEGWRPSESLLQRNFRRATTYDMARWVWIVNGQRVHLDVSSDVASFFDKDRGRKWIGPQDNYAEPAADGWRHEPFPHVGRSSDEVMEELRIQSRQLALKSQKLIDQYDALLSLPQLFIAV